MKRSRLKFLSPRVERLLFISIRKKYFSIWPERSLKTASTSPFGASLTNGAIDEYLLPVEKSKFFSATVGTGAIRVEVLPRFLKTQER